MRTILYILTLFVCFASFAQNDKTFDINSSTNIVNFYDEPLTFDEFVKFSNSYPHQLKPYFRADGTLAKLELDLMSNNHVFHQTAVTTTTTQESLPAVSEDYKEMHSASVSEAYFTTSSELQYKKAPDFKVYTLGNDSVSLDDLKDKVVVMNFWFSKCAPCLEEIPDLNALKDKYGRKNVVFLAMSIEKVEQTQQFLQKVGFNYIIVPEAHKLAASYKVPGYPTTFIIDKGGEVSNVFVGKISKTFDTLDKAIQQALLKKSTDIRIELMGPEESLIFAQSDVYDELGNKLTENDFYNYVLNYECIIYKHTKQNQSIYYTLTKTVKK